MSAHRTLLLMRHAKSAYPPDTGDHQRPLAPRGISEAGFGGNWLRANAPAIDRVLSSTATRTRETLTRTGITAPAQFVDRLYGATPGMMIEEINKVSDDVDTLLVVGHEPTMSEASIGLAGPASDPAALERISVKFPTSGIAVLRVAGSWAELELGGAELVEFHVPRAG